MVVCLLPRAKRRYELVLMVLQSGTKNSVMMEYLLVYVSQLIAISVLIIVAVAAIAVWWLAEPGAT